METATRCGQHHERPGALHRSECPLVHRRGDLAGHRVVCGRRDRRRTGVHEPGPLAAPDLKPDRQPTPWWIGVLTWYKTGSTLYSEGTRGRVPHTYFRKGAPAERGCSGTVSRRVGRRHHQPVAGV